MKNKKHHHGSSSSGGATSGAVSKAVSMKAKDWNIAYSSGMPPHPTQDASGGWHFDWDGEVHYVLVPFSTPAVRPTVLEMSFRVATTGDVKFHPTQGEVAANFRPMIERQGDDMVSEFGRFWSNQVFHTLSTDNLTHTLTVPLTGDHWTSVYGHNDGHELKNLLSNLGYVGITFGGQFFGHGVFVEGGTARFELNSYTLT